MISLIKRLFRTAEDRLSNPIVGAIVVAWIIWNWKPIAFFILSNKEVEDRLHELSQHYTDTYYLGIIVPIILAALYIVLLPYVSAWLDRATLKATGVAIENEITKNNLRELKSKSLKIENLLAKVDSLENEKANLITENTEQIKRHKQEISTQKVLNEEAVNKIHKLEEEKSQLQISYNETVQQYRENIDTQQEEYRKMFNNYESKIGDHLSNEKKLNTKITNLQNDNTRLTNEINNTKKNFTSQVNDLQRDKSQLIMSHQFEIKKLTDAQEKELAKISNEKQRLNNILKSENDKLRRSVDEKTIEVETWKADFQTLQDIIQKNKL